MDPTTINRLGQIRHEEIVAWGTAQRGEPAEFWLAALLRIVARLPQRALSATRRRNNRLSPLATGSHAAVTHCP